MNIYKWNAEKNELLLKTRNISFIDIVKAIDQGGIVDVFDHPNQKDYPEQKIYCVKFDGYIYLVPFIKNDNEIFLKTIIPSRKAVRKYSGRSQ